MKYRKEDPLFKKRFGISTSIRYEHDVIVEPKWEKAYEKAWKRFYKKTESIGSLWRKKRFDSFLKRLEKLGDDLPYCKRVAIRYVSKQVGYGVFATQHIPPYSILNHYAGILKPDKTVSPDNDSAFMFSDFKAFSIDAKRAGNWTRFMNHGGEDGSHTNVVAWEHYSKWGPRILFTASGRGIKKGKQLLYSYGDSYWDADAFVKM